VQEVGAFGATETVPVAGADSIGSGVAAVTAREVVPTGSDIVGLVPVTVVEAAAPLGAAIEKISVFAPPVVL